MGRDIVDNEGIRTNKHPPAYRNTMQDRDRASQIHIITQGNLPILAAVTGFLQPAVTHIEVGYDRTSHGDGNVIANGDRIREIEKDICTDMTVVSYGQVPEIAGSVENDSLRRLIQLESGGGAKLLGMLPFPEVIDLLTSSSIGLI